MAPDMLADPETDPTATYAVDPALARRLTARVVCSPRAEQRLTRSPFGGAPLASLPLYSNRRRGRREYRRAAQRGLGADPGRAPRARAAALPRPRARPAGGVPRPGRLESGKTRRQAFEEVADVALVSRYYARTGKDYLRTRRRPGLFPVLTQTQELHHPKGVVGIVSPWNYP